MRTCSVLLTLAFLLACNDEDILTSGNTQAPAEANVNATQTLVFNPTPVTIRVGGRVNFIFGATAHTVIFEEVADRPDHIVEQSSGKTESRTFTAVGNFNYECGIHDGMQGTVIVVPLSP